jgi:hypothetical protein
MTDSLMRFVSEGLAYAKYHNFSLAYASDEKLTYVTKELTYGTSCNVTYVSRRMAYA